MTRLRALAWAAGFLALAFGIRLLTRGGSGVLAQDSGTALYASTVYAGVFVLAPRTRPAVAGAVALAWCWLVEFSQLTGVPAVLSAHSIVARLVLGTTFDWTDVAWYPAGIIPAYLACSWYLRRRIKI